MSFSLDDRLADMERLLRELAKQASQPAQRWLSIAGSAEYCSLSEKSIRQLVAAGKLTPHRPCKGKILLDRLELDSLIAGATQQPRTGRGRGKGTNRGREKIRK